MDPMSVRLLAVIDTPGWRAFALLPRGDEEPRLWPASRFADPTPFRFPRLRG